MITRFSLLLAAVLFFTETTAQLNVSGKPGLINIPTARETQDGEFRAGYVYNPVKYAIKYTGRYIYPESIYAINLSILPRLDLNLSLLAPIYRGNYRIEGIGDRQMEFKYQLLTEKEHIPAIALYASLPFSTDVSICTNVLVATKNFKIDEQLSLEASVGYGSPWFIFRDVDISEMANLFQAMKIGDKREEPFPHLAGPIAGAKLTYQNKIGIMAEWDSQRLNTGLYAILFNFWTIQAGLIGLDAFTVGTSMRAQLKKVKKKE